MPGLRLAAYGLIAVLLASATACKGPGRKKVGEATLAVLGMGAVALPPEAKDAPTVEILPDKAPTIPNAPVVKLAIDGEVSWGLVKSILMEMAKRNQTPVLLVAEGLKVRTLHLSDELKGPTVTLYTEPGGKICVHHPEVREAKCHKSRGMDYVDPASARELTREAIQGYQRNDFTVEMPDAMRWSDVVSTVGGARSCCAKHIQVRVAVEF